MIEALQLEQESGSVDTPFGPNMEAGIVSLLLDFPELYVPTSKFITVDLFSRPEIKYVIAALKQDYEKFGVLPTRPLLHDRLAKQLTADDPHLEILGIVTRPRAITPRLPRTIKKSPSKMTACTRKRVCWTWPVAMKR